MHPTPTEHTLDAQRKRLALVICAAVGLAAVISAYAFRPALLVVCGSFLGGLAGFYSWRAALRGHAATALAHALVSLTLALSAVVFAGQVTELVMLAQALPWLAFGLLFGIVLIRRAALPK
jgi:hypothetical protein